MPSPVSEKAAEILFNRYMLQWLGLGKAQLFAPSTPQEFLSGYDAKVVGAGALRELYLQFKAPTYSARDTRFTFELTPHQHARLQRYPTGSAFYVAGYFTSLRQLNDVQSSVATTEDFLRYYVCIDVAGISATARCVTFAAPASQRHTVDPGYKDARHGKGPKDFAPVESRFWERGNSLVARLKQGQVGRMLSFGAEDEAAIVKSVAIETPSYVELPSPKECQSLGSFVRILGDDAPAA